MASSGDKWTNSQKKLANPGDFNKKLADKKRQIQELQVLNSELKSVKKEARVYKQQPNSSIFFKEDKHKVFSEAKKNLDDLLKEYNEAEKPVGDTEVKG